VNYFTINFNIKPIISFLGVLLISSSCILLAVFVTFIVYKQ